MSTGTKELTKIQYVIEVQKYGIQVSKEAFSC